MSEPLIHLLDIHKDHEQGQTTVRALRGLTLDIHPGEFVVVTGPSGSGKSTMMNVVGLLDRPSFGRYVLAGRDAGCLGHDERALLRAREIGFIFQAFNLLGRSTALENVELALTYTGHSGGERRRRAIEALDNVGLADRQHHWPGQLSGGEQQRVAIARVLAKGPRLILADEPTGSLDSTTSDEIMALLQALHIGGKTIVLVTHNPAVVLYGERAISMRDGRITHDAPVTQDKARPAVEVSA
jgi:putative ABC transport system ATP-binding protein